MRNLYKVIGVGVLSLPLIFGGCGKKDMQEYKLQGTTFSEMYRPAKDATESNRYSFVMDTELGRKAVQVEETQGIRLETIDDLIEPGTKVEIEIKKDKANQHVYKVNSDKIKVLGK